MSWTEGLETKIVECAASQWFAGEPIWDNETWYLIKIEMETNSGRIIPNVLKYKPLIGRVISYVYLHMDAKNE